MPVFAITLWLAAPPAVILIILAIMGLVPLWLASVGVTLTVGAGWMVISLLARDIDALTEMVRLVRDGAEVRPEQITPAFLTPLHRELAGLSRAVTVRTAHMEQDRRAGARILSALPDPLLVLRADQSVAWRNNAAVAAFHADLPAVLRHPALAEAFNQATAAKEPRTTALALAAPVARELLATVVPLDPPTIDNGTALVVLSDRTRERSIERAHTDFVANVSHELRTPLASLIGFTETLMGPAEDDPPARRRFLAIMAEQGARMNRLIDDLLSLSRIEMAEHQVPEEPVDLKELLPKIVTAFEPRLGQVSLSVTIAPETPVITADADQITQVLNNLLENAVKYGKEAGTARLTARPSEPGQRWPARPGVVIAVTDDGPGIPRAAIPRLTERFYRVDKGRSRAAGGTGLGLAIVKHIVNRHRGQLAIESVEGQGTTVSAWLPVSAGGPRES
jgi:two-component system, OmpR family, phosphate regulon sensor histidine kinase PhoR